MTTTLSAGFFDHCCCYRFHLDLGGFFQLSIMVFIWC
ncbi:hypothetical protein E1A91_A05G369400v1 [Gossypium mustelinum]|uniref:Uncharacterized protein n=1 Tax=Gossypium mustelinum TaxID=34275 RepID=A0A5D2ZGR0_GOSMU|nr:hypothetical protein E1A91_A05G369400v1 [Gossypium mustelinum]